MMPVCDLWVFASSNSSVRSITPPETFCDLLDANELCEEYPEL